MRTSTAHDIALCAVVSRVLDDKAVLSGMALYSFGSHRMRQDSLIASHCLCEPVPHAGQGTSGDQVRSRVPNLHTSRLQESLQTHLADRTRDELGGNV